MTVRVLSRILLRFFRHSTGVHILPAIRRRRIVAPATTEVVGHPDTTPEGGPLLQQWGRDDSNT